VGDLRRLERDHRRIEHSDPPRRAARLQCGSLAYDDTGSPKASRVPKRRQGGRRRTVLVPHRPTGPRGRRLLRRPTNHLSPAPANTVTTAAAADPTSRDAAVIRR
jgi:hypothetical protein